MRHCSSLRMTIRYVIIAKKIVPRILITLLQNIYSVSKAKEKDIATSTKLVNIKDGPAGKEAPQDGQKVIGKSIQKGPIMPQSGKGGCEGKENSRKTSRHRRRPSSRKKSNKSRKNRHSSSKHRKHRSHSNSKNRHKHRGHSRSLKKSVGKRGGNSPDGKEPRQGTPPPCPGKEPGPPADLNKTLNKDKSLSEKPPKQQQPEDGGTVLIAPADYKVISSTFFLSLRPLNYVIPLSYRISTQIRSNSEPGRRMLLRKVNFKRFHQ